MEPLPGWAAHLAEVARRPAPAPKRRLALPKAASYYTGQLWRRALPLPPVGPPPSELRRAARPAPGPFGPRWSPPPLAATSGPKVGSDRLDTPTLGRGTRVLPPAGSARWCPAATSRRSALDTGGPRHTVLGTVRPRSPPE